MIFTKSSPNEAIDILVSTWISFSVSFHLHLIHVPTLQIKVLLNKPQLCLFWQLILAKNPIFTMKSSKRSEINSTVSRLFFTTQCCPLIYKWNTTYSTHTQPKIRSCKDILNNHLKLSTRSFHCGIHYKNTLLLISGNHGSSAKWQERALQDVRPFMAYGAFIVLQEQCHGFIKELQY